MRIRTSKEKAASEQAPLKYDSKDRDSDGTFDKDRSYPRRRPRPPADLIFDYKDVESIRPFITEGGRIVPARVNRLSRKQQRELTREIKRARQLALLPIATQHSF